MLIFCHSEKKYTSSSLTRGADLLTYGIFTIVLNRAKLSLLTPWNTMFPLTLLALPRFNGNISNCERSNNFGSSTESIHPTTAFLSWAAVTSPSTTRRVGKRCLRALLTNRHLQGFINRPFCTASLFLSLYLLAQQPGNCSFCNSVLIVNPLSVWFPLEVSLFVLPGL